MDTTTRLPNWQGSEIEVATSAGGVTAVVNPWDNLVQTGVAPWPPAELIQKLYQSRQVRAFRDANLAAVKRALGFYSDLQSIHSEDAITWSVLGPLVYAENAVKRRFVQALLDMIEIESGSLQAISIWLWRRLPHPDTLVSGGPEIDFGIQTDELFLLGESKWLSEVGAAQGVRKDKDQVALRREFCSKYGPVLLPRCRRFVVLGVSLHGGMVPRVDEAIGGADLHVRDTTWQAVCGMPEHPLSAELQAYLAWKTAHSRIPVRSAHNGSAR